MSRWFLSVLLGSALLCGCANQPADDSAAPSETTPAEPAEPTPAPPGQSETPDPENAAPAADKEVTLDVLSWEEITALVPQYQGKVVVMDLWATYCPPCVAEFPNLVQLHKDYPDQIAAISVSLDYDGLGDDNVESYKPKVLSFLKSQNAVHVHNILCGTDAETLFTEKIQQNSMPVVYVYDQEGKLAAEFPNPADPAEFTYQKDIRPVVEKLLATQ